MARVQNTLIGRASGSVGDVVFFTWKLLNVTRSKGSGWANPRTIGQKWQRNKYGFAVELFRNLSEVITLGCTGYNIQKSLFNYFLKINVPQAFNNIPDGTVQVVPHKLVFSYGLMYPTPILVAERQSPSTNILVTWGSPAINNQNESDHATIILFNETTNVWQYALEATTREEGFFQETFPNPFNVGNVVHVWLFFNSNSSRLVSNTTYKSFIVA